jgi:hypothetical protein
MFTAVILSFVAIPGHAAEWYVLPEDKGGRDTNADTNAGTIAAPFATLTYAASRANAGDTIWVRGGEYPPQKIHGRGNGTAGPVVVRAYGPTPATRYGCAAVSTLRRRSTAAATELPDLS